MLNQEPRTIITMPLNHVKATSVKSVGIDPTDTSEGCNSLIWLPISQIADWFEKERMVSFSIPSWLVQSKQLVERCAVDPAIKFSDTADVFEYTDGSRARVNQQTGIIEDID